MAKRRKRKKNPTERLSPWWGVAATGTAVVTGAVAGSIADATSSADTLKLAVLAYPIYGVLGVGVLGLVLSVDPHYRAAGLTSAALAGGLLTYGIVKAASKPPQVTA
jgi:hypothetical protein